MHWAFSLVYSPLYRNYLALMANFLKESMAELEHVVWPTHIETKKFFQAVVGIIAAMALFTYLLTLLFSNSIFGIRTMMHAPKTTDLSGSPVTAQPLEITTDNGQKIEVNAVTEPKK